MSIWNAWLNGLFPWQLARSGGKAPMIGSASASGARAWINLWAKILVASVAGMIAFVFGMLWVLSGFHGLGVDATTGTALILGTAVATALGVALMGLLFYSEESGVDQTVRGGSASSPVGPN